MFEKLWKPIARFPVVLIFVAGLVLAGCADGDEGQVSTTKAVTTETTAASTTSDEPTTTTEPTTSSVTTTKPAGQPVEIYFGVGDGTDCGEVQAFVRNVDASIDPYRSTFVVLVAGPTESESAAGASSFFSSETANVIKSAVLADGLLRVDFTDIRALIPNASSSCGSGALLAQLNSTAFQFPEVERTRFLIEGSCGDFANWLQRACFDTNRAGEQLDVPTVEQADGSGCTPASTDTLPAGRWFGYISSANADELSFDLACWFTGEAAVVAASEDNAESPPPNDYYVRNISDQLRTHQVDSATEVQWLPDPGNPQSGEIVSYADWLANRGQPSDSGGYWITVEDDSHVIAIEEQYVP